MEIRCNKCKTTLLTISSLDQWPLIWCCPVCKTYVEVTADGKLVDNKYMEEILRGRSLLVSSNSGLEGTWIEEGHGEGHYHFPADHDS